MSKKGLIITSSIILFIILLNVILFGFVFRLRNQNVIIIGENINYTNEEIISTADIKNGKSTFLIDKDKAIKNIENKFSDLKVIQIKTTNITSIEIKVRKRYATYYYKHLGLYYVLDEDLKVLDIKENVEDVQNLISITSTINNLNETTKRCNFVGNGVQKNICYNLYTAVYTTQMSEETGAVAHTKFCSLISSISFDIGYTADGQSYNRLKITTSEGIQFDIGKADIDLQRKINICFTTMNSEQIQDKTKGIITISYDESGKEIKNYTVNN